MAPSSPPLAGPPRPRPPWLTLALLASLGINMFIGGYLIGHKSGLLTGDPMFDGPPGGGPPDGHRGPPPSPADFLRKLALKLPPHDAALARALAEQPGNDTPIGGALRGGLEPLRAALMAEPFSPEDLLATFTAIDKADMETRQRLKNTIVDLATRMTPEGRRALAEFRPGPPGPPPGHPQHPPEYKDR